MRAHLDVCASCAAKRDQLLASTRAETWAPDQPPPRPTPTEPGQVRVPASARARIDALARSMPQRILGWTAEPDGDDLRATGDPLPPRTVEGLDVATRLVAVVDAVLAIVELHREGLAHGALAPELVRFTDTGRVRLPWPALVDVPEPATDGPALADIVESWAIPDPEPLLDALRDGDDLDILAATLALQTRLAFGDQRYRDVRKLGEGGMGVVYEVEDGLLNRRVALKRLKPGVHDAGRFVAEAQLTAQLQHPGIVPVHALGEDDDGRPFYTMEVVDGQTLEEVLDHRARISLARLVDILARVCDAVAYAHDRGVVHRDLKPSNIMVGRHGEVRVMDWGIAKVLDAGAPSLRTVRTEGEGTVLGRVAGSPRYLAPEVGPTNPGDQRRDVFALGRILGELLQDDAPPALIDLADGCTRPDPTDRPADAAKVAEVLRDWLDGLAKRRLAEASVEAAVPVLARADAARTEAATLRARAAELLDGVRTWSPLDDKREAWTMEDRAAALDVEARVLETRYEQGLRAALDHDPDLPDALARIAELYKSQLARAESADAPAEVARLRTLLEDHDGGRHRAWLDEGGRLTLRTDPEGATVWLDRYVEVDRRLVPEPVRALGATPVVDVPLDRGSWRLRITHPDTEPIVYPLWIERGTRWDDTVHLPPTGSLGPDDRFVAGGWFVSGGDPEAGDGLPRRSLWVDSFVMRRFPVTVAEYTAFLDALVARDDDPAPFVPATAQIAGDSPLLERRDGAWVPTAHAVGPRALQPDWPVTSITWHAARAFAAWRAEVDGLPWRLPHDQEWEKAARGVDGRPFPWGRFLDGRFAGTLAAFEGPPRIQPVHAFELDESPYGVRGLAGNVRDWCLNRYTRDGPGDPHIRPDRDDGDGPYRTMRGGSCTSQAMAARAATRLVERPTARILVVGLRLVRSAPI